MSLQVFPSCGLKRNTEEWAFIYLFVYLFYLSLNSPHIFIIQCNISVVTPEKIPNYSSHKYVCFVWFM